MLKLIGDETNKCSLDICIETDKMMKDDVQYRSKKEQGCK
jgi:hypothetical protein